jgi:hypothetical protein
MDVVVVGGGQASFAGSWLYAIPYESSLRVDVTAQCRGADAECDGRSR